MCVYISKAIAYWEVVEAELARLSHFNMLVGNYTITYIPEQQLHCVTSPDYLLLAMHIGYTIG